MINFLDKDFLGNTIENYVWFGGILIFGMILIKMLSRQLTRLLFVLCKNYGKSIGVQKFIQVISKPVEHLLMLLVIYLSFSRLTFPENWNLVPIEEFGLRLVISQLFKAAVIISVLWLILRTIDVFALIFIARKRRSVQPEDGQLVSFLKEATKVVVVGVGFFVLLAVIFRLDIVSLVAGLGIGGLAIALAAKETIENLLGSFTIFLDKPFVTGDIVKVGNVEGTVESVGFRSTRIRALDKMSVTVPNKKMIEAELINESDRHVRRSSFTLILHYDTTEEQLRKVISELKSLLTSNPMIEHGKETVRFRNFGQLGFELLVVFIFQSPKMDEFLAAQEEINFNILEIFKRNNVYLATSQVRSDQETRMQPGYYNALSSGK